MADKKKAKAKKKQAAPVPEKSPGKVRKPVKKAKKEK